MYGMFRMSIEVSCVCISVYSTKDASWIVSGGSFQKPVLGTPTNSDTDYILSILYIKVYLIILNEEKGGTCAANLSLRTVWKH